MFLYELELPQTLTISLAAATRQLKADIDAGAEKPDWTTEELLRYYNESGIPVGRSMLLKMVSQPPLNTMISNIQGDTVVFKGQGDEPTSDEDQNQQVVQQMAQSAMK